MCYNEVRKSLSLSDVASILRREFHLSERRTMTTIPPHAHEGNFYTVYALIDQRDYSIRYIGITDDVYARFAQHLRPDGSNPAKDAWIAELKLENVMLIMKTLETVATVKEARERETFWIHHHRFLGASLLNQQIPSIRLPEKIIQPPLIRIRKQGNYGRKFKYEQVKEIILYRYQHGCWPEELSADMRQHYEFNYFTKPKHVEAGNPKKHAQHIKSYERGRQWIAEFTSPSEAIEGAS